MPGFGFQTHPLQVRFTGVRPLTTRELKELQDALREPRVISDRMMHPNTTVTQYSGKLCINTCEDDSQAITANWLNAHGISSDPKVETSDTL